jgi:hypothetical protein
VIVSEGRRLGVPVPLNEAVWRLVWGLGDTGTRVHGEMTNDEGPEYAPRNT